MLQLGRRLLSSRRVGEGLAPDGSRQPGCELVRQRLGEHLSASSLAYVYAIDHPLRVRVRLTGLNWSEDGCAIYGSIESAQRAEIGHFCDKLVGRDDEVVLERITAHVSPEWQGKGIFSAIVATSEARYAWLGVDRARTQARLQIGRYTWAKWGYDFCSPLALRRYRELLAEFALKETGEGIPKERLDALACARDIALYDDGRRVKVSVGGRSGLFPLGKAFFLSELVGWDGERRLR